MNFYRWWSRRKSRLAPSFIGIFTPIFCPSLFNSSKKQVSAFTSFSPTSHGTCQFSKHSAFDLVKLDISLIRTETLMKQLRLFVEVQGIKTILTKCHTTFNQGRRFYVRNLLYSYFCQTLVHYTF